MNVREQGLGALGRRAALAQPQLTLLCRGQRQGWGISVFSIRFHLFYLLSSKITS